MAHTIYSKKIEKTYVNFDENNIMMYVDAWIDAQDMSDEDKEGLSEAFNELIFSNNPEEKDFFIKEVKTLYSSWAAQWALEERSVVWNSALLETVFNSLQNRLNITIEDERVDCNKAMIGYLILCGCINYDYDFSRAYTDKRGHFIWDKQGIKQVYE